MGWASAGEIFDPVAQALVDLNAPDDMKIRVLGTLIGKLLDGDWDTWDESLEEFQHDAAIVQAFRQHGVTLPCSSCGEVERYCECADGWHWTTATEVLLLPEPEWDWLQARLAEEPRVLPGLQALLERAPNWDASEGGTDG